MSVAGIATTAFSTLAQVQNNYHNLQTQFKRLGQDLSTGNLAQAQTDFVALSQSVASQATAGNTAVSTAANSSTQAASPDQTNAGRTTLPPILIYASVKQQFLGDHGTHPHVANSSAVAQQNSGLTQMLNQLGQALQSGNLLGAQQAFAGMQQLWLQNPMPAMSPSTVSNAASPTAGKVNLSV
jgi:hypothetical protein